MRVLQASLSNVLINIHLFSSKHIAVFTLPWPKYISYISCVLCCVLPEYEPYRSAGSGLLLSVIIDAHFTVCRCQIWPLSSKTHLSDFSLSRCLNRTRVTCQIKLWQLSCRGTACVTFSSCCIVCGLVWDSCYVWL